MVPDCRGAELCRDGVVKTGDDEWVAMGEESSSPVRTGDFVMDSGVLGSENGPRLLGERSG